MLKTSTAFVFSEYPEAQTSTAFVFNEYPEALFVAGQLIFEHDTFWNRTLHNETAFIIQRRLQQVGVPMIVLPVRLDLKRGRAVRPLPRRLRAA